MSKAWSAGSTRRWRRIRAFVLVRDNGVCQLCQRTIPPGLPREHPDSACVHHTRGKRYGDDPAYLVAAHRRCNTEAGDPEPKPVTKW